MKNYDAMIVIDMQEALVKAHPHDSKDVLVNIGRLIQACREKGVPVIYVRHDGGVGDELEKGSSGWQIYHEIGPAGNEAVFDKSFNSAFKETGLKEYLEGAGAQRLIMCGMQTEYCFDVSVKVAFEYGFTVTVPRDGVTTYGNEWMTGRELTSYFADRIWQGRYARVKETGLIAEELNH